MKLLFIGAGNMAQAIISGVIQNKIVKNKDIFIYEINKETAVKVMNKYKVKKLEYINSDLSKYDIILFAVKPQVFFSFSNDPEMKKLNENVKNNQLIVSIMAGVTIDKIKKFFSNNNPVIRIMPNTPALIGESMSAISISKNVTNKQLEEIKKIFFSIGKVEVLDEKYIDAVTGLSGSGPAYVVTFIEAMIQGGISCGLTKDIAEKLVLQSVLGSTLMIDKSNITIEELRQRVTSKGGTTIEGLTVLKKNNFNSIVINAIKAATKRAKELSK